MAVPPAVVQVAAVAVVAVAAAAVVVVVGILNGCKSLPEWQLDIVERSITCLRRNYLAKRSKRNCTS